MGIWGQFALRHFNISPLNEGLTPLRAIVLLTFHPVPFTEFIDKRNISRQDAIKVLRSAGYENVVETRDLNALLDGLPTDFNFDQLGPVTGFYSRLDAIWVLCFNERLDAVPFWNHHASLE
jgi:hypothetical protein